MITPFEKIVIVGGGASGLELVTKLGKKFKSSKNIKITLVDRNPSHLWKPLFHKVASGVINKEIDSLSYLAHSRNYNFKFQLGSITSINRKNKIITLEPLYNFKDELLIPKRNLSYDILVLALGSVSNDFNIPGVKEFCIHLSELHQAYLLHQEILSLFLKNKTNFAKKISIVIIGGGATGVELSAELYKLINQLQIYYDITLTNNIINIILIEAGDSILPTLPFVSNAVYNELNKLGIRILTKTIISSVDKNGLYTKTGDYIKADIMIWVAGIKAPDFMKNIDGMETNHINQLIVRSTLQTTSDSNIFAIGDCASCTLSKGLTVPPRAQAAHQMANVVLHNIQSLINGKPLKEFFYKDYGSIISLSDYSTIGVLISSYRQNPIVIKGKIVRLIYTVLYRIHQSVLHGFFKTVLLLIISKINRIIYPYLKLY